VFAVPGPIFARQSAGPLRLLRDGAGIATCADDLLSALEMTRAVVQHEARVELPSDPVEAAVLAGLGYAPLHIDELARAIALPTPVVTAALAMLELKGLVRQPAAMQYVLSR
jgi:DNA processing protein